MCWWSSGKHYLEVITDSSVGFRLLRWSVCVCGRQLALFLAALHSCLEGALRNARQIVEALKREGGGRVLLISYYCAIYYLSLSHGVSCSLSLPPSPSWLHLWCIDLETLRALTLVWLYDCRMVGTPTIGFLGLP